MAVTAMIAIADQTLTQKAQPTNTPVIAPSSAPTMAMVPVASGRASASLAST